jgi:hypothetical protein
MASDANAVEQAVARTLRDNLDRIQRSSDELHEAINDLVAACGSSRPSNALPPMVRAQASAASLSAALDVLSRFVTGALQPSMRMSFEGQGKRFESDAMRVPSMSATPAMEQPPSAPSHPRYENAWPASAPVETPQAPSIPPPAARRPAAQPPAPSKAARPASPAPGSFREPLPEFEDVMNAAEALLAGEPAAAPSIFNLDSLPREEQELHRRAYRVAKVSMQDIKMLRPEEVRLGRLNRDLCIRLRDDIEKAHKEYDRRFQSIQGHPVDYFYDWLVEILGGGDPQALGEYPYPSAVLHR